VGDAVLTGCLMLPHEYPYGSACVTRGIDGDRRQHSHVPASRTEGAERHVEIAGDERTDVGRRRRRGTGAITGARLARIGQNWLICGRFAERERSFLNRVHKFDSCRGHHQPLPTQLTDPFGHRWNIAQHLRDVPAEEIAATAGHMFAAS
jgi:3',5'-cyclic AMP phosphodiesterase CpdA